MRLEIIRNEQDLRALQPFWDPLLESSATPAPFLRWDWVDLWWAECAADHELAVGVVRDSAEIPLAIAPLVIGRGSGARRHLRQLSFLNGIGSLQGERMDFMVPKEREAELTPVLCGLFQRLQTEWDVVRLNKVPAESPNYPILLQHLRAACRGAGVLNRAECRFLPLPKSWNDFETKQSGNWRRKMRKRWDTMMAEPGARLLQAGQDATSEVLMEEFLRLHALHWPAEVSSFLTESSQRLHRRLAAKWLPTGRAFLPSIEANGEIVAGIYGFGSGDELYQYQLGWDPRYARLGLGNLSMRWSIECAMARGFSRYDMLPGDYEYKRSWCESSRFVVDLESFHPRRPRAALFRALRYLKRRVSARPLPQTFSNLSASAWLPSS